MTGKGRRADVWRARAAALVAAPTGLISLALLSVLVVLAVLGPHGFGSGATEVDTTIASQGPSPGHLLGTDALGRDIFARTLAATRLSLVLAAVALALAALAGGAIGAAVALARPRIQRAGAALIDTTLSFGDVLLGIMVIAIIGVGDKEAVVAVAVAFTPSFARYAYNMTLSAAAKDYVVAARVIGLPGRRVFSRHILPNTIDSFLVTTFTLLGEAIIAISSLSFLGLGVQDPQFDWGQMLTEGVKVFYLNPWAALAPAIMISGAGLVTSGLGDALARAFNPLLWEQRPSLFRSLRRVTGRVARPPEDQKAQG